MVKASSPSQLPYRLFRFSLASLPFLYYASLVGLAIVIAVLFRRFKHTALDPITRNGLLAISVLLVLSASVAFNRGEAFLQLTNFLPFFVLFGVLPFVFNSVNRLERVAIDLVLTSIPINIIAFFEYLLKLPHLSPSIRRIPFVHWVRSAPHKGRAMVMFDHPNALASYLVLVFGLGLGLILGGLAEQQANAEAQPSRPPTQPWTMLLFCGTFLNLVGIFSSGSRNGILVAISQLVIFTLCVKASRHVLLTALFSIASVLIGAALFGIGGRALSLVGWADDPRVGVWRVALGLIHDRPWLGWGLGNYKFLYPLRRSAYDFPHVFHPHNFWLLLSSEAGLLVMVGLTALVGYICCKAASSILSSTTPLPHRGVGIGYLLSFWGCMAFALFDVTFYDARINVLNWAILAGLYSIAVRSLSAKSIAAESTSG
ncbi:O-antigen ligase family protein [Oculatella sp. LEGE 06141]|uniref:O-antigen ligase family protein n=1 Tax=Oculatella sp. LEGE 06141 TaxID=1828648 RepID=UPI0018807035|nr:O-antigen ligase family protein [Oculatella sp. LEGE 06141]MBE9177872.1 O-antigen ligase family protein [Oculatella sp. LEGE 06141]